MASGLWNQDLTHSDNFNVPALHREREIVLKREAQRYRVIKERLPQLTRAYCQQREGTWIEKLGLGGLWMPKERKQCKKSYLERNQQERERHENWEGQTESKSDSGHQSQQINNWTNCKYAKAFIFKSNIIRQASYTIYFISQDIGKLTHNAKYTTAEFVLVPKEKKTERQNLSTERDRDLCQYMTY